jgi:hypothetical protein
VLQAVKETQVIYDETIALAELFEEIENCGGKPEASSVLLDDVLLVATRQSEKAGFA